MKHKIFIDGQEGTTGLRIRERLQGREDLMLLTIEEAHRKDPEVRLSYMDQADITFLCLPDTASRDIIKLSGEKHRILDTSTAHRVNPEWVYGLPELEEDQRNLIFSANRVAVPGCHATGFILLAKPLMASGMVAADYPFVCHSITGYSGGGKAMIGQYEDPTRAQALSSPRQYGLCQDHKHLPEMKRYAGSEYFPVFHPILGNFYNGMLVSLSLHKGLLQKNGRLSDFITIFTEYFKDQPLIQVFGGSEEGLLSANALAGKDALQIFVLGNDERITLMARYDNLGKGASGAAIQCMNLMLGLPEEKSLIL